MERYFGRVTGNTGVSPGPSRCTEIGSSALSVQLQTTSSKLSAPKVRKNRFQCSVTSACRAQNTPALRTHALLPKIRYAPRSGSTSCVTSGLPFDTADPIEQSDHGQAEDALPEPGTELQAKTVN